MQKKGTTRVQIIERKANPEKWDLAASLFCAERQHMVTFAYNEWPGEGFLPVAVADLPTRSVLTAKINKIEAEDGSGNSWNISGYAVKSDQNFTIRFEGYYNSRDKNGVLNLECK